MQDRFYGFFQNLLVFCSPPGQHIGVTLDHRDGGPEFVGGVVDKPRLLPVGIRILISRLFIAASIPCRSESPKESRSRLFRLQAGNRFLDLLIFILRKRHPAQLVGFQRNLINGRKDPADPALLLHIGKTDVQS